MRGDQARLALHRRLRLEAGVGQRGGQPLRCNILVNVTRLELDHVNIAGLLYPCQVLGGQNGPLAQVGAQVVDQYAADHILFPGLGAKSMSLHYWQLSVPLRGDRPKVAGSTPEVKAPASNVARMSIDL